MASAAAAAASRRGRTGQHVSGGDHAGLGSAGHAATAAAGGAVAAPASQRGRDILAAPCVVRAAAYGAAGVGGGDAAGDSGREVLFERAAAGQGGSCQQAPLGGARLGECREQLGTKFESLCEEVETLKHSVQEEV
eukprot:TRINITY_DN1518_c0_g1_i7.p2 TRINITY_DN1518_c0_g1~~TRINITY_DN1518_c0_g1_i7.p2  ORF type:complete len:136 (+),score=25.28 TRINITY_DN1518_c0_g1_i7:1179-1586(+)